MVDASAVARVLGVTTTFKDLGAGRVRFLPQRILVLAQGSTAATYATDKVTLTGGAKQAGDTFGYGSPIHLIVRELLPANGDGVGLVPVTVLPLEDDGAGVPATADITPSGTAAKAGEYRIKIGGELSDPFVLDAGAIDVADFITKAIAAINAVLQMPFIPADGTTKLDLACKWKGTTGNGIPISVVGPDEGLTFTITQPAGGLTDPSITAALAQIGDVWETMGINALGNSTGVLDELETFGEGRWGELVRKPLVWFFGNTTVSVDTVKAITAARPNDRVNSQLTGPGSPEIPFVVAARQISRIAVRANENPPRDYGGLIATDIETGTDGEQWNYTQRNAAVVDGTSTTSVADGEIKIEDIVTAYHPTGEEPPAYRYVVDIVKLQTVIYNLELIFAADEWIGAPLVPDEQPTTNPDARKPKNAVAEVRRMLDNLALAAVISDPEFSKERTTAAIDGSNPKRLNVSTVVKLSGNSNVIDVELNWGFYFG